VAAEDVAFGERVVGWLLWWSGVGRRGAPVCSGMCGCSGQIDVDGEELLEVDHASGEA
jgi:hypothetical protein